MARSLIRGEQVTDEDFISNAEHADPNEIPHTFLMNVDTPATYSGAAGKFLYVSSSASGIEFYDGSPLATEEYVQNIDMNLDGGTADTVYEGTTAIDGGDAYTTF